jgi:hypothetical protein
MISVVKNYLISGFLEMVRVMAVKYMYKNVETETNHQTNREKEPALIDIPLCIIDKSAELVNIVSSVM